LHKTGKAIGELKAQQAIQEATIHKQKEKLEKLKDKKKEASELDPTPALPI
jgi:hypothetical protein